MPIRFRCDTCRCKLSIATRKIGTPVDCPRCSTSLIVPTASQLGEELTELLLGVTAAKQSAVAQEESDVELAEPVSPPRPHRPLPRPTPAEMPLFERADFDTLLESSRDTLPKPLPLPAPVAVVPAVDPNLFYDSIILSRAKATLLAVGVVVLLGLAFGSGYIVRGFAIPTADGPIKK